MKDSYHGDRMLNKFCDWLFGPDTRNNPQHDHIWELSSVTSVYGEFNHIPVAHLHLLRCKICGDLKTHKHQL
jgi:hypothetical protein